MLKDRLKKFRLDNRLTQLEMGNMLGIGLAMYGKIETGKEIGSNKVWEKFERLEKDGINNNSDQKTEQQTYTLTEVKQLNEELRELYRLLIKEKDKVEAEKERVIQVLVEKDKLKNVVLLPEVKRALQVGL